MSLIVMRYNYTFSLKWGEGWGWVVSGEQKLRLNIFYFDQYTSKLSAGTLYQRNGLSYPETKTPY